MATGPFVRIPPRRGNIRVPVASRRATLAGLALYAPCRPYVLAAHHSAWALVAALGPWVLRADRVPWKPPMGPQVWGQLCDEWRSRLGPFDRVAVYERPQASRSGVSVLLLADDRPLAFVKVRQDVSRMAISMQVLATLSGRPSAHFRSPSPLDQGECAGWGWLGLSPMPPRPHRPARRPPLAAIVGDIQARLRSSLAPADVPPQWAPMHGDLTPWNLRLLGRSELWLLDWEEAAWGPPLADEVYFAATAALLLGSPPRRLTGADEAVRFW
ncbi:MAG: phosphotransferase, partial [Actinomycetota bacterium]|nr:phosphotransferase [Actinomycetota bacterium]